MAIRFMAFCLIIKWNTLENYYDSGTYNVNEVGNRIGYQHRKPLYCKLLKRNLAQRLKKFNVVNRKLA